MVSAIKRILITPGEPAGIGPDILIRAIQQPWACELIAVADPLLLTERATQLQLPFTYQLTDLNNPPSANLPGQLKIMPVPLHTPVTARKLQVENAPYVIKTLEVATDYCLANPHTALVTGPVQKSILNKAGIPFTGHTEWLAMRAQVLQTVMLFVVAQLKVALATTHLPLKQVPAAITQERLTSVITILQRALSTDFACVSPTIGICGLNPHAGENGYLGREEIDVITPALDALRTQHGWQLEGPLPADTIFIKDNTKKFDAILAMYHDQALPLIKYLGFEEAVNVTLGLPFMRTSVDHGTALDLAGTGKAHAGSLIQAITLAAQLRAKTH